MASDSARKWSIYNPPPEGDPDVAKFAWELFLEAQAERKRLTMEHRWNAAYKLYRGDHDWRPASMKRLKPWLSINLFFANVQRTVANLTSRNPVAEVVDLDGRGDGADKVLTARLRKWWKDTQQSQLLNDTAQNMEVYGSTIEKAVWDEAKGQPEIIVVDPYSFFPAPGAQSLDDCRYVVHCSAEPVVAIEERFSVSGVQAEESYSILKGTREESRPVPGSGAVDGVKYDGGFVEAQNVSGLSGAGLGATTQDSGARALLVELWIRDESIEVVEVKQQIGQDPETGEPIYQITTTKRPVYPGGIRVIQVTNSGNVLLKDSKNPSINPTIPLDIAKASFLWDKFPFWMVQSYRDTSSLWGFSASELVGDLNRRIEQIFSRIYDYTQRCLAPPLILPKNCGISRTMISSQPNLILEPTSLQAAQFIRFLPIPPLSGDFYKAVEMMMSFFDRVYQIQDADRGINPAGVRSANAILALQEQNAVLIQHKIRSTDYLVERRGMGAVSLFQNFGIFSETIDVDDSQQPFTGVSFAGRNFNYVVEAGSTMPRTTLQIQQQAVELFKAHAIDVQALLEVLNFPGWRQIIERAGENQLDAALQVLIQAGLPQDQAVQLKQYLMQPQGGPGTAAQPAQGGQNAAV